MGLRDSAEIVRTSILGRFRGGSTVSCLTCCLLGGVPEDPQLSV